MCLYGFNIGRFLWIPNLNELEVVYVVLFRLRSIRPKLIWACVIATSAGSGRVVHFLR
jgi:hypothetical protein